MSPPGERPEPAGRRRRSRSRWMGLVDRPARTQTRCARLGGLAAVVLVLGAAPPPPPSSGDTAKRPVSTTLTRSTPAPPSARGLPLPSSSTSTTGSSLDLEVDGPAPSPPLWEQGWVWGLGSMVVVVAVVGALAAARAGPTCFCVTPSGTPCDGCDP